MAVNGWRGEGIHLSRGSSVGVAAPRLADLQEAVEGFKSQSGAGGYPPHGETVAGVSEGQAAEGAHGEIESKDPGYLVSQDTYHLGTIKGVGRFYQQTFIDTYI